MGFFRNSTSDYSAPSYDIFGESYDDSQVALFEDYDFESAYEEHVMEFNEAKLELVNGIINYENRCFSEGMMTDEEIYTEGVVGSIWDKIKALGTKIKEFIKKLWTKFTVWFNGTFKSNAEFWKKYSKKIQVAIAKLDSDWEVTLKFDTSKVAAAQKKIDDILGKVEKDFTVKDGHITASDSSDFSKALADKKDTFRDNLDAAEDMVFESTDYTVKEISYSDMDAALKNNKGMKDAEKIKTKIEKTIDKKVKDAEKNVRDAKEEGKTAAQVQLYNITAIQAVSTRALSLYMRIVKGNVSTQRTLAMKVLSGAASADYKNKTE